VQEARALIDQGAGAQVAASTGTAGAPSGTDAAGTAEGTPSVLKLGAELIQRVFEPKAEREQGRSALGAPPSAEPAAASVPYKVMNSPAPSQEEPAGAPAAYATAPAALTPASTAPARSASPVTGPKTVAAAPSKANAGESRPAGDRPATDRPSADNKAPPEKARFALAGAAATAAAKAKPLPDTALPPAANQKCRVWTASYGGQRSIIIRSIVDQVVNFTVLDVNNGQEQREAEAFIAAYAKNGKIAGEYANQAQALDKAFELCPEG
jgi:hypothetical protein